jgi:hypothetical protein
MKTTVGAFCFAEEKAKKNAEIIEQVINTIDILDAILSVHTSSLSRRE